MTTSANCSAKMIALLQILKTEGKLLRNLQSQEAQVGTYNLKGQKHRLANVANAANKLV